MKLPGFPRMLTLMENLIARAWAWLTAPAPEPSAECLALVRRVRDEGGAIDEDATVFSAYSAEYAEALRLRLLTEGGAWSVFEGRVVVTSKGARTLLDHDGSKVSGHPSGV